MENSDPETTTIEIYKEDAKILSHWRIDRNISAMRDLIHKLIVEEKKNDKNERFVKSGKNENK